MNCLERVVGTNCNRCGVSEPCLSVQVVLGPGDAVYIPPFYFHYVEALEASVSVRTP